MVILCCDGFVVITFYQEGAITDQPIEEQAWVTFVPSAVQSHSQLLEGILSPSMINAVMEKSEDALSRVDIMLGAQTGGEPVHHSHAVTHIFKVVTCFICHTIILPALETTSRLVASSVPDLSLYECLARTYVITKQHKNLLDSHVSKVVHEYPEALSAVSDCRRGMVSKVDGAGVDALHVVIKRILSVVDKAFAAHSKTDYCPKETSATRFGSAQAALGATKKKEVRSLEYSAPYVTKIEELLTEQRKLMEDKLRPVMSLEPILNLIGLQLHGRFIDLLLKQQISTTGGLALAKDVNGLRQTAMVNLVIDQGNTTAASIITPVEQSTSGGCSQAETHPLILAFDALNDMVPIYLVAPDQLPVIIAQGSLNRLDNSVLLELIRCRVDAKTSHGRQAKWVRAYFPNI